MKSHAPSLASFLLIAWFAKPIPVQAQNDKDDILRIRNRYNAALRNYDDQLSLSFMTEGVLTTISNGTLIQGKENLREYIAC